VRDDRGYVVTGKDLWRYGQPRRGWHLERLPLLLETSMAGVFAVGDVRQGSVKRVASAVGEGSIAVQLVHEYLRLGSGVESGEGIEYRGRLVTVRS
jgi:thioredoxin reductase (NADPH)